MIERVTDLNAYKLAVKRLFDVVVSCAILIISSPLLVGISIAIKVSSKGPVFFKQNRLGYKGQTFVILKFRTMVLNAERIGTGLCVASDDSRITKVGGFLRKTSLDELPQLINVLKNEMSLIGPRPPATYYPYDGFERYPRWAKKRFDVKPGITGYAQVKGRNSIDWIQKIKLDVEYVKNWSLTLDARILFKTIQTVMKRKEIYSGDRSKSEIILKVEDDLK